ncbi:uncharacterized protein [Miscanthus floridulus]|uniref:uncharacterized protein isoform X2 n=1 Tax=Miscanthus floridulus TaxID=154761 RepID=UPI003458FE97
MLAWSTMARCYNSGLLPSAKHGGTAVAMAPRKSAAGCDVTPPEHRPTCALRPPHHSLPAAHHRIDVAAARRRSDALAFACAEARHLPRPFSPAGPLGGAFFGDGRPTRGPHLKQVTPHRTWVRQLRSILHSYACLLGSIILLVFTYIYAGTKLDRQTAVRSFATNSGYHVQNFIEKPRYDHLPLIEEEEISHLPQKKSFPSEPLVFGTPCHRADETEYIEFFVMLWTTNVRIPNDPP